MSEELSTSVFSITGKTGRLAYFFQNSILMLFGFQYIYGAYIGEVIKNMQSNPLFHNAFQLLQSDPSYADFLKDLNQAPKFTFTVFATKYAFILALRIVDLKRIRDIVNRKLSNLETILVLFVFSLPFVDLISTLFLVTLPPKKTTAISTFLKEAHSVNLHEAQREKIMKNNKELFEAGKISKTEYLQSLEKLNGPSKK